MARNTASVFLLGWLGIVSAVGGPVRAAESGPANICSPEPAGNDAPAQALSLAGAFCIEGALGKRRHLFAWTVADDTPGQAWSVAVDGGPGQDASLVLQRRKSVV